MEEQEQSRLLHGYEQMLHRLRTMMDQPDHLTRPRLHDALQTAKQQSVEHGELTEQEAERIGEYLRRDLEQAAQYTAAGDQDLAGWLHMDLQLIEDWLLDQFAKATDLTKVEFLNFQHGIMPPEIHTTGEVAGPGVLFCSNCGHMLQFDHVDIIPACPNCSGTEFVRPVVEEARPGGTEETEGRPS